MAPHRHPRCIDASSTAPPHKAGRRTPALDPIGLNTTGMPEPSANCLAASTAAPSIPAIALRTAAL